MAGGVSLQRPSALFGLTSVDLVRPPNKLGPGRYSRLTNVRSYTESTIQSRGGLTALNATALADLFVHSVGRLNDPTAFNGGTAAIRVIGAGTNVTAGPLNGPFTTLLEAGWSGNPLTFHEATPPLSPQPWLYIADSSKQRKVRVDGIIYQTGIAQPNVAPSVALNAPGLTVISEFDTAVGWAAAGAVAGAPASANRVNTTIAAILYDSGNTGWASISATAMTAINEGMRLVLGGAETVLVTQVTIAVAATTIGAIIYDVGTTGLCTIQAAASLGVGQLQGPTLRAYRDRAGYDVPRNKQGENIPVDPLPNEPTAAIRQVDFPVNCLVTLGGATETVRILSVAVGPDGVQSFRCVTAGTHAAADTITGVSAFRAYLTTTRAAGNTVVGAYVSNVLTPAVASTPMTGGVSSTIAVNLALINGRATLPDDDLHISVRVNRLTEVQSVRVYFDIDAAANTFLLNYYFFEWRANDIIAAIQATNAAQVTTVIAAQGSAITNTQISQSPTTTTPTTGPRTNADGDPRPPRPTGDAGDTARTPGGRGTQAEPIYNQNPTYVTPGASSSQLAVGNDQWIELRCKVRDLIRVGTDPTRTLANVAAVQVLFNATSATALTVYYDSLWLSGGFGPDVGNVGVPYVYRYRYRSTITGARSNPSPASRGGVLPRRQRVLLTATASGDTQADVIDWFTFGGQLARWTYCGTSQNSSPSLNMDLTDSGIDGGEGLTYDDFQPWPTVGIPVTGVCSVAGTAVFKTSGTNFNTAWAPGTVIILNGVACTLYQSPISTTLLMLNENPGSGTGTGVAFTVPNPTVLSQNLPTLWGDVNGYHFAAGDANNPGTLYWTKPNEVDVASDTGYLIVTDQEAGEPIMNGCIYDRTCFAISNLNFYEVLPAFDTVNLFRAERTACEKGLWSRWALAVAPEGIYFLSADGIYLTHRGAPAISITDDFLRPLFPHDGQPGVAVNGYNPPDMTAVTSLRLSYSDRLLFFDYLDTQANPVTLIFDTKQPGWVFDRYAQGGAAVHTADEGPNAHATLIGGRDGRVYRFGATGTDNGTAFNCTVRTGSPDYGDARTLKYYRDVMVDLQTGGAAVAVTAGFENFTQQLSLATDITQVTRDLIGLSIESGGGYTAHNMGLEFTWAAAALVVLYEWQPAFLAEPLDYLAAAFQTKGTALGMNGYAHLRDGYIAYASQNEVTLIMMVDGEPILCTPSPLPSTDGGYVKAYIVFPALKGKIFTPFLTAEAGFEFFPRDSQFRAKSWGSPNPYNEVNPFVDQY